MRKMLALSEPSKTRPYQGPTPRMHPGACTLSMALPMPGSGLLQHHHSPSPSPGLNRRSAVPHQQPLMRGASHERSHSDAAMPVDLSAESSSVTSLANLAAMRKSHMSGSVTSTDSAGAAAAGSGGGGTMGQPLGLGLTLGIGLGIGLGADVDAGYCTQFETHSSNSSSSDVVSATNAAGHAHLMSAPGSTESPPVAPRTRVPLYPHGTQGKPPFPPILPFALIACHSHSSDSRSISFFSCNPLGMKHFLGKFSAVVRSGLSR